MDHRKKQWLSLHLGQPVVHQKWPTLVHMQDSWTHTCCFMTVLNHQTAGGHPSTGRQSGLDAHVLNSPRILKSHTGTPWPEPAPQIHCFMVYNIWSRSNNLKLENFTLKKKSFLAHQRKERQRETWPGSAAPWAAPCALRSPTDPTLQNVRNESNLSCHWSLNLRHYSPSTRLF